MKKTFFLLLLATGIVSQVYSQVQTIAHRGFWDTTGSAQNSIAALVKADSINCYGSEFDVWLAKDGVLVVNHDAMFKGKMVSRTSSKKLTKLQLKNGETMPTLKEYLEKGKNLKTKQILELKAHKTSKKETKAVEKIVGMVEEMGLQDRVEYISFSLHAVKEFIRLAPTGTPVYYLEGNLSPAELKEIGCAGPDYHLNVFKQHPQWIKECHDLGMKVNCWTVNKRKDMEWLIENQVDFITTDNPVLLNEILQNVTP